MMHKTAFLALFLVPALAHADPLDDLRPYAIASRDMREYGAALPDSEYLPEAKGCYAVLDKYKDMKADDVVKSPDFKGDPDATEVGGGMPPPYALQWKNVKKFCQRYEELSKNVLPARPLEAVYDDLEDNKVRYSDVESYDWYLAATDASYPAVDDELPRRCASAIDKAIAAGASDDVPILFGRTESLTLDQLRARCAGAGGEEFRAKVKAWGKARYDEIAARYKKAGIKGKRLDLFVYTDGSLLEKGCDKVASDPKKMKKAKKLFQWSEAADGTIWVRTYKFKGDSYSVSERQYTFPETAYRGCK